MAGWVVKTFAVGTEATERSRNIAPELRSGFLLRKKSAVTAQADCESKRDPHQPPPERFFSSRREIPSMGVFSDNQVSAN
jgi:hypothetical protein